jgi:hypothetical protein
MATTTIENLREAFQQYQAGTIVLGEFFAILLRFLDVTEEEPEPEAPPPAPAPAPAPAASTAKKEK